MNNKQDRLAGALVGAVLAESMAATCSFGVREIWGGKGETRGHVEITPRAQEICASLYRPRRQQDPIWAAVSDLESGKARAATGGEYHEFMALVAAGTGAGIHFLPGTFALIGRGVQPALAGAIMGAKNGMQQIPSRLLTFLPAYPSKPSNPAGPYSWECAVCQLEKGWQERPRYPGADCGPVEVLPGIFAAGFEAAKKYAYGMAAEGAGILSLCRTFGVFDDIPIRREMSYLVDSPDQNPGLYYMVHDAVTTASAWKKEGRRVLVHCHGGASRTGLILRALAMHMFDEPAWKALCRVRDAWPIFSEWNTDFSVALERAEKDIRSPSYSLTH